MVFFVFDARTLFMPKTYNLTDWLLRRSFVSCFIKICRKINKNSLKLPLPYILNISSKGVLKTPS